MSRYQKIVVCKGKWADSTQNPERNKRRQDRRERREIKVVRSRATNMEGHLRRVMAEEVGEDELSREFKFALLQKFGLAAPRIDRKVTKPHWIGEKQWNQMMNDWMKATKGLVPAIQRKKFVVRGAQSTNTRTRTLNRAPNPSLKKKFRTERAVNNPSRSRNYEN